MILASPMNAVIGTNMIIDHTQFTHADDNTDSSYSYSDERCCWQQF